MESVDTKDLKSFGYCSCAGSSPASGTKQHSPAPHVLFAVACAQISYRHQTTFSSTAKVVIAVAGCVLATGVIYVFSSTAKVVIAVAGCVLAPGAKQRISIFALVLFAVE